ncbi:hypothetical protein PR003_g3067 [Phytophthora rubi]|uniref:Tyr recombinase domain-containing protein n=1 Tax=Phytophthora rubi TaxID=129364 RepID=A0A6A4FZM8_9STRA|nr:hypothetical protein PR003_g3067 [Phytophthora rubi]
MTEFLRKDLQWWQTLVFQTEFAGMPMNLFDHTKAFDEVWLVTVARNTICITGMKLQERLLLKQRSQARDGNDLAYAVSCVTDMWGPSLSTEGTWCHVVIHGERWITELIDKMNCKSLEGQQALRQCRVRRQRVEEKRDQLKQASVSVGTLGSYSRNFKFWETFCNDFGFPVWIDELPRARQSRMVGLFAALCASEGPNKARKGNKYQTFDGKMAAVAFAHKAVRNAKLDYHDPEFELIAQGYKRSHGDVDRKQPVTTPMLLKMYELRARHDTESDLMWGSVVLAFFFLDRSSELWGPVVSDKSTGVVRTHCVKAANVILRDNFGTQVGPEEPGAMSVEVIFESHKGDRVAQGTTVRHYKSNHAHLCPVAAARLCLNIRAQWLATGRKLGPYLTSVSSTRTIKKTQVANLIKMSAADMGLPRSDYSTHSLRIGGACALLAAGKSDLVIRLLGRWASWCFTVYTRLRPGMIRDAASCMIKASTWECHEQGIVPTQNTQHSEGGTPGSLTLQANQVNLPLAVKSRRRKVCG